MTTRRLEAGVLLAATMFFPTVPIADARPAPPARAAADPRAALETELARIVSTCAGEVGIAAVDLTTGERVGVQSDASFPMQSVYKLPIAIAVLQQVQAGATTLDQRVRIGAEEYHPGYSPLRDRSKGAAQTTTVRELIEIMLVRSDNTACDVLLRLAGGPARVTAELRRSGVTGLSVDRSEMEMMGDLCGLARPKGGQWTTTALDRGCTAASEAQVTAARARFLADPRDTSSPAALADMLARLSKGELLDKANTSFVLATMRRCETGPDRLKAGLPASAALAHKTGTAGSIGVANDVGLATLPGGGTIAIVVMCRESGSDAAPAERAIASIGRAVYEYYARRAAPSSK